MATARTPVETVLREEFAAVSAGYHLNKWQWNTVGLDGSMPDNALRDWIQNADELIKRQPVSYVAWPRTRRLRPVRASELACRE